MGSENIGSGFFIETLTDGSPRLRVRLKTFFEYLVAGAAGSGMNSVCGEIPTGTINGTNRSFTLAATPVDSKAAVFSDQVRVPAAEYTIVGTALTFVAGSVYIPATSLIADYRY